MGEGGSKKSKKPSKWFMDIPLMGYKCLPKLKCKLKILLTKSGVHLLFCTIFFKIKLITPLLYILHTKLVITYINILHSLKRAGIWHFLRTLTKVEIITHVSSKLYFLNLTISQLSYEKVIEAALFSGVHWS